MPGMLNPHRRSMPAACDRGCEGSYPVQLASKQEERRPLPYVNTVRRYPPAQSDRLQFPSASQEQQDPRSCNSGLGNHNREKHAVRCETGAQPVEIKSTHNHFAGQVSVIFGTRLGVPVAGGTLQTAINFNNARASADMCPSSIRTSLTLPMHLSRDPMTRSPSSVGLPITRRSPLIAMRASTELTRRLASSSSMPSCPPPTIRRGLPI